MKLSKEEGGRFGDIYTAKETQVFTRDNKGLPANRIGQFIASQYPLANEEHLANHLKTLAEEKKPLLVLSSDDDIFARALPKYFREPGKYNDVTTTVRQLALPDANGKTTKPGNLELKTYELTISIGNKDTTIKAYHITNWADRTTVGHEEVRALAQYVGNEAWVHCSAGVGRTGTVIVASLLEKEAAKPEGERQSLETIINTVRNSRNHTMVQTQTQFDTLATLARQYGIPILAKDEKSASQHGEEPLYQNIIAEPLYQNVPGQQSVIIKQNDVTPPALPPKKKQPTQLTMPVQQSQKLSGGSNSFNTPLKHNVGIDPQLEKLLAKQREKIYG